MNQAQTARHHMIDGQLEPNRVVDERIIAAMGVTPRERFVPPSFRQSAYVDEPLPLGHGRFLMPPVVLAQLIQALEVHAGDKTLVVAGNTGYSAVLLAQIGARVQVLEDQPELAEFCRQALRETGFSSVPVMQGALADGCPDAAPFDHILIDGAVGHVPAALFDQLAEGGRLAVIENRPNPTRLVAGMGQAVLYTRRNGLTGRQVLGNAASPVIPSLREKSIFTL